MTFSGDSPTPHDAKAIKKQKNNNVKLPAIDPKTISYIPAASPTHNKINDTATSIQDSLLPPICVSTRTEFKFMEVANNADLIERLQTETLKFIIQRNFYVLVKVVQCSYSAFNCISFSFEFRMPIMINGFRIFIHQWPVA